MKQSKQNRPGGFLTRQDYICILVLTLLFTVLVFFRLGNTFAPESGYTMGSEKREIILDFGEYRNISSVSVFLGNLNTRRFALSAFNEVTGEWEVYNEDAVAESVFAWNKIDMNYYLRYLGIVTMDDEAVIEELVFQDPEGNMITPINAAEYQTLFDEQDMFPEAKTYMSGTMFDEVYHARTSYEFLHGLPAYETTHPHLGKILISLGIAVFGMNPFGWRVVVALFGILMVPLIYLFAKRLSGDVFTSFATALLLVFDCMHFALSRIGTIDIIAGFFILLMYYWMYRYMEADSAYRKTKRSASDSFQPGEVCLPLALSGAAMACGIATKWTGIYAGIGLAVLFIWYTLTHYPKKQVKKLFLFCCLFFIVLPLALYTLCFIPVVGYEEYSGLIDKAVRGTKAMFDYHANLVAEHYYSSPFYEWPVIWMPLLYANDAVGVSDVSAVSCMGNPAIWWAGIPCTFYVLYRWVWKKDKKAGFLTIAYLAQYVPWMSVGRITFIYHYFPSILFVILMMGYTMQHIRKRFSWGEKAVWTYLVIAVACFGIFYPVVSGIPCHKEWGLSLRLLKDWILVL